MLLPWRSFGCKCFVFKKTKIVFCLLLNDIYGGAENAIVTCMFILHFVNLSRYTGTQAMRIHPGIGFRDAGKLIITGANIHIFVFCITNLFWSQLLFMVCKHEYMNICTRNYRLSGIPDRLVVTSCCKMSPDLLQLVRFWLFMRVNEVI